MDTALVIGIVLVWGAVVAVVARRRRRAHGIAPLSPAEAAEIEATFARIEAEHLARSTAAAERQVARLVRDGVAPVSVRLTDDTGSFALARVRFADGTDLVLHGPVTLPLVAVAAALRSEATVRLRGLERLPRPTLEFAVNGRRVLVPARRILHLGPVET